MPAIDNDDDPTRVVGAGRGRDPRKRKDEPKQRDHWELNHSPPLQHPQRSCRSRGESRFRRVTYVRLRRTGQATGYRMAEACSAKLSSHAAIRLIESLEQTVELIAGNADSGIRNVDSKASFGSRGQLLSPRRSGW